MDEEKRRQFTAATVLGAMLILAVGYFVWGVIKILLPHDTEPQEIATFTPILEEVASIPRSPTYATSYTVERDQSAQKYALMQDGIPLVYFPVPLKNPKIFGSAHFALVIDENGSYSIDITTRTKQKITGTPLKITAGTWSKSGEYFLFNLEENSSLFILNKAEVKRLKLKGTPSQTTWTHDDTLVFATTQTALVDPYDNELELGETPDQDTIFGLYDPSAATYTHLATFSELTTLPAELLITPDKRTLYFAAGPYFKIILE